MNHPPDHPTTRSRRTTLTSTTDRTAGEEPPAPTKESPLTSVTHLPILLTVEEAAERLRVGRTTMYALLKTGAIESVPVGRLRRIPPDALDAYIARLRESAGAA